MGGRFFSLMAATGLLVLSSLGCSGTPEMDGRTVAGVQTGFSKHEMSFGGEKVAYSVYVPADFDPGKKYPTVLFLHGMFEGGDDGTEPLKVGIAPALPKMAKKYPMIVIFPQTTGDWRTKTTHPLAMGVLDDVARRLPVDPSRVILTGLSTGGQAVWAIAAEYPGRFAALVPMCAHTDYDDVPKLTRYPIWAFHNSMDPFVSSGGSEKMVKKINDAGGNAKYTEYGAFGHNCWDKAFGNENLYKWMLTQRRRA